MKNIFEFKSLTEFTDYFSSEEICQRHFAEIRFRNGEYCPHCQHKEIYKFSNGKRYRCAQCKQDFTIKTKTIFGDSKIPLRKWFVAIYLLSTSGKGISSIQLAKQVGVTQKTGWFIDHRISEAMQQNRGQLFGTVEVNETYVGGLEKNKHAKNRIKGTQGRSCKTKTPIIGMIQRGGEARIKVVPRVSIQVVEDQVRENVKKGSTLYTDDFLSYTRLGRSFSHQAVSHKNGEFVKGDVHSNTIEGFWSLFKRGYHGIYHYMSPKHMQRYVDEFTFRFNRRGGDMKNVFSDTVVRISESPKLSYKALTQKT